MKKVLTLIVCLIFISVGVQADRVIEFVKSDSPLADKVNAEYAVIKEVDKKKCKIVERVGEAIRCKSYCLVRDICPHNSYKENR